MIPHSIPGVPNEVGKTYEVKVCEIEEEPYDEEEVEMMHVLSVKTTE